jgi:hypothetical protein
MGATTFYCATGLVANKRAFLARSPDLPGNQGATARAF